MPRKLYHVKMEALLAALNHLGYRLKSESGLIKEFINPPFHLYVRLTYTLKIAILNLHMDIPKALNKSERIRKEYDTIVNTYVKIKAGENHRSCSSQT